MNIDMKRQDVSTVLLPKHAQTRSFPKPAATVLLFGGGGSPFNPRTESATRTAIQFGQSANRYAFRRPGMGNGGSISFLMGKPELGLYVTNGSELDPLRPDITGTPYREALLKPAPSSRGFSS